MDWLSNAGPPSRIQRDPTFHINQSYITALPRERIARGLRV